MEKNHRLACIALAALLVSSGQAVSVAAADPLPAAEKDLAGWEYTDQFKDEQATAFLDKAEKRGLPILVAFFSGAATYQCPKCRAGDTVTATVRAAQGLPRIRVGAYEVHLSGNKFEHMTFKGKTHPKLLEVVNAHREEWKVCWPRAGGIGLSQPMVSVFTADGHLVGYYEDIDAAKRGDEVVAKAKQICDWYAKFKVVVANADAQAKQGDLKAALAAIQKAAKEDEKFSLLRMTSLHGKAPEEKTAAAALRFHPDLVATKTKEYQEATATLIAQSKEGIKDPKSAAKAKATLAKLAAGPADWPQVVEAKSLLANAK